MTVTNKLGFYIYLPNDQMLFLPPKISNIRMALESDSYEGDREDRRDRLSLDDYDFQHVLMFAQARKIKVPFEADGVTVIGWDAYAHIHRLPSPTASASPIGEISKVI